MVGNQLPAECEGSNLAPIPVNELGNIFFGMHRWRQGDAQWVGT